jgi:Effector-associated domain 1
MKLSGEQRKKLRDALISAFPYKSLLEQLLYFELDNNLNQITPQDSSLDTIIFELIRKAEAEGWIEDLVRAAHGSIPKNSLLQDIAQELLISDAALEKLNITTLARHTISQTMAMVFVDLMRLLYVATGNLVRTVNAARYPEFINIAEQHFADFRSHIARFSTVLDVQLNELSLQIERRLSWVLWRLKSGPDLFGNDDYFNKMQEIGQQLHSFCINAVGEGYQKVVHQIDESLSHAIINSGIAVRIAPVDEIFRLRSNVQSQILENSISVYDTRIFTIADDMDHNFGISYFVLDQKLLKHKFTSAI